jgi:hypothetical protein
LCRENSRNSIVTFTTTTRASPAFDCFFIGGQPQKRGSVDDGWSFEFLVRTVCGSGAVLQGRRLFTQISCYVILFERAVPFERTCFFVLVGQKCSRTRRDRVPRWANGASCSKLRKNGWNAVPEEESVRKRDNGFVLVESILNKSCTPMFETYSEAH